MGPTQCHPYSLSANIETALACIWQWKQYSVLGNSCRLSPLSLKPSPQSTPAWRHLPLLATAKGATLKCEVAAFNELISFAEGRMRVPEWYLSGTHAAHFPYRDGLSLLPHHNSSGQHRALLSFGVFSFGGFSCGPLSLRSAFSLGGPGGVSGASSIEIRFTGGEAGGGGGREGVGVGA